MKNKRRKNIRQFNRDTFYKNKPVSESTRMRHAIEKAFPNIQDRNDYVDSLIESFDCSIVPEKTVAIVNPTQNLAMIHAMVNQMGV